MVVGTLLITPYVLDYDLVLLAAPIAWIALEGLTSGFLPWEKSLLLFAWIAPMWSRWVGMLYGIPLGPVVLALVMIAIIRRAATLPSAEVAGTIGVASPIRAAWQFWRSKARFLWDWT
jgi:hypothetical protein